MSDFTHAELLAACQRARPGVLWTGDTRQRNAHVDDIEAILSLHRRVDDTDILGWDHATQTTTREPNPYHPTPEWVCENCQSGYMEQHPWPCPTAAVVIARLQSWGALPTEGEQR